MPGIFVQRSGFRPIGLLIIISIAIAAIACERGHDISWTDPLTLSSGALSGGAYLTRDHRGNPVLCWTEGEEGKARLYFSVSQLPGGDFQAPVAVPPSTGTGLHAESMNKVAFKPDGTIVAVYEKKHPHESNPYAGSILYSQSFDNGVTWTTERYVHADTSAAGSRSFFDVATLPDGEIGVVWLDDRLKLGREGSSLFFAKTNGRDGFDTDYQVGETVCECCRTNLYVDKSNGVHIIFRDIELTVQGQVRDFAHIVSTDDGASFSDAGKVSNDRWVVDGCPHTGASMAANGGNLEVVWFTAGGTPGLYRTVSADRGRSFRPRELIAANGFHPQIAASGKTSVVVMEERNHEHAQGADHVHGHAKGGGAIVVWLEDRHASSIKKEVVSEEGEFPVVLFIDQKELLVAYTQNEDVIVVKGEIR